ncbi:MAG TPA: NUMOD3 domain-containing DNA-binding protein [Candidatus Omnitrophota bacterium]|nr:NUMOD3 domain-containing DNA-binding protein [Candidatus Omnitrophota bacterium]
MGIKKIGLSEAARSKMSRAMAGKKNPFYGKHHSKTWIKQEQRRKVGKNNPMFGKKHKQSTIRKIRQAALLRSA